MTKQEGAAFRLQDNKLRNVKKAISQVPVPPRQLTCLCENLRFVNKAHLLLENMEFPDKTAHPFLTAVITEHSQFTAAVNSPSSSSCKTP